MASALAPSAPPAHRVDPVTYQVILSRLDGIVQEMQYCIYRTGYSTIIRETHDASCLLMDANGDIVGQHAVASLHPGTLAEVVRAMMRTFGDDIAEGDAYITNHPYLAGTPHSIDMAVITPFFHDGKLVAFSGGLAHKSDLGGPVSGTGTPSPRTVPRRDPLPADPARAARRVAARHRAHPAREQPDARPDHGRHSRPTRGRAAGRTPARGNDRQTRRRRAARSLRPYARSAETQLRKAIASWPDGVAEGESIVDTDGIDLERSIRYHVKITKNGDRLHFDLTGCSDQVQGPINIQPTQARAALYYALVAFVDTHPPINGGARRVVETTFRARLDRCANYPCASGMYMASCTALAEATLQALSQLDRTKRHALNGGTGGNVFGGRRADGSTFIQYELIGSAYGGSIGKERRVGDLGPAHERADRTGRDPRERIRDASATFRTHRRFGRGRRASRRARTAARVRSAGRRLRSGRCAAGAIASRHSGSTAAAPGGWDAACATRARPKRPCFRAASATSRSTPVISLRSKSPAAAASAIRASVRSKRSLTTCSTATSRALRPSPTTARPRGSTRRSPRGGGSGSSGRGRAVCGYIWGSNYVGSNSDSSHCPRSRC